MKSVFVGYAENSKAYRLLDLSFITVVKSRDVEFIENKFSKDSVDALILLKHEKVTLILILLWVVLK